MYSRPSPHVGDVAPGFRTVGKKEGGEVGRWVCVWGGGGWPKATAWATKGGPTWGREQIFLPSRNTNNQKKNFQTGAAPMPPRREMFFALLVARGKHGRFHPRQAGCTGRKDTSPR